MDDIGLYKDNLRGYDESGWDLAYNASWQNNLSCETAAVLIPLFIKNNQLHVVLTRRSNNVATHKGQISFPGGKREQRDSSIIETALRETHEEIGICAEDVEVISTWQPLTAKSKHPGRYILVYPVIGILKPGFKTTADNGEVAEVFDVPLEFFLQSKLHIEKHHNFNTVQIAVHFYEYYDETRECTYYIWGMTGNLCLKVAIIALKQLPKFELKNEVEQTYNAFVMGEKPKYPLNSKI